MKHHRSIDEAIIEAVGGEGIGYVRRRVPHGSSLTIEVVLQCEARANEVIASWTAECPYLRKSVLRVLMVGFGLGCELNCKSQHARSSCAEQRNQPHLKLHGT